MTARVGFSYVLSKRASSAANCSVPGAGSAACGVGDTRPRGYFESVDERGSFTLGLDPDRGR